LDFIKTKNELLAAIYNRNFDKFENLYNSFAITIAKQDNFSEEEQKAINQIRSAISKFSKKNSFNCTDDFQNSKKLIQNKMSGFVRRQIKKPEYVELGSWFKKLGLSKKRYHIMLKTTAMVQMSVGCSNCCRRCNEWALPGPRKHFSFNTAKMIIENLFDTDNKTFSLYGASDPLDWEHKNNDITDILAYMERHGYQPEFGLLTKIPRSTEKIAEKLLASGADVAVSITSKNKLKINIIEKRAGKKFAAQHDVEHLEIPAGLDEDFSSVKPSITDYYGTEITPEGASLVIPAFTSALNPTGQHRIPVSSKTPYFLDKIIGRDALTIEYFKPLRAIDIKGNKITLKKLLNVQIENILLDNSDEQVTPPGMMNLNEYFRTFDADAVKQRKKMASSVIKRLKGKMLKNCQDTESKQKDLKRFKKQVDCYLDFCSMERIVKYKIATFSFYLHSIADYLNRHPAEKDIVLFLRRKDRKCVKRYSKDIESTLKQSDSNTYDIFQPLLFRLLENPCDDMIHKFINNSPAKYDPETDRFVAVPTLPKKTG